MAQATKSHVEDLASRMGASDEQAFQEFAEQFGPQIRAFFMSKGLRAADAEDLAVSSVTDICLRVEKYEYQEDGGFEGWVFTLARHFLADWRRSYPVVEALPDDLEDPGPVPEKTKKRRTAIVAVRQAVKQLSETDQLVLRLRYLEEERSFNEIGDILGIKPGAARTRHSRALAHLKTVVNSDHRITDVLRKVNGKEANSET